MAAKSRASFSWFQNFSDVSRAFQKTTLVADMCFNRCFITVKQLKHTTTVFSYILILFALTLTINFPDIFQT